MMFVWLMRFRGSGMWQYMQPATCVTIGWGIRAVTIESAREDYGVMVPPRDAR
jgi:hypothetical protein